MTKIKVSRARILLEQNFNSTLPEVSDTVFIKWCNYINRRTYNQLVKLDPEKTITTTNISLISGTSAYALPVDFKNLQAEGAGVFETDSAGNLIDTPIAQVRPGSRDFGYYLSSGYTNFTPTPTESEVFKLRYIPTLTKLVNMTDDTFIDEDYEEFLENALVSLYYAWKRIPNNEAFSDQRFVRSLNEMLDNYRQDCNVFELDNTNSSFI